MRGSTTNEVFPEICSGQLGSVAAGSIALIPHHDGPFLTLIADESAQQQLRSIVILNLKHANYPSVVFHDNWENRDACLYYKTPLRFEMSNKVEDIGTNATWWRNSGVIASIQNEFFIRALSVNGGGFTYVNIQSGRLFHGDLPNFFALFGVWSIWLRDPLGERSSPVFDFDVRQAAQKT